jgi:hypothetical protein
MCDQQTVRKGKRHGGIIGPVSWSETKGAATQHLGEAGQPITPGELQGGTERITDGQTKQRAPSVVDYVWRLCDAPRRK